MFFGTINNNLMQATIGDEYQITDSKSNDLAVTEKDYGKADRYLSISDEVTIGNKAVYFQTNSKTVTPADGSFDIKLGNTSTDNVTKLTNASNGKGWGSPLATFWAQRGGAATLTVGGLTTLDSDLPVYVLALPVSDTGAVSDVPVQVYAAQKPTEADTSVNFTLPDISGDGYAIAIVQPAADYGTLTISGPDSIQEDKTDSDYSVTYTVKYDMSDSMKNIIKESSNNATYSLAINQDYRLTGIPGTFDGSSIEVTYTLPRSKFDVGESLFTSAELTITIGDSSYTIPSNVVKTQMVASTPTPPPTPTPTATPTAAPTATPTAAPATTPTPVVTVAGAIPKTGDDSSVTLWMVLCVASALALGGVSFYSRKKR